MNVKFLKATLAVVCMVAAGAGSWKAYSTYEMKGDEVNILFCENIEALSYPDVKEPVTCYNTITSADDQNCYYCPNCVWMDDSKPSFWSTSGKCNP